MSNNIELPENYEPTEHEEYMSPLQLEYFKRKLLSWKNSLLEGSLQTIEHLREDNLNGPDFTDRASVEIGQYYELRTQARLRKLIDKIDDALRRIENGTYGFCDDTGEPIGLARLKVRPIATLSIIAQERHERIEQSHNDD